MGSTDLLGSDRCRVVLVSDAFLCPRYGEAKTGAHPVKGRAPASARGATFVGRLDQTKKHLCDGEMLQRV